MLPIIIGIVIIISGIVVLIKFSNPFLFIIGLICFGISFGLGTSPISGYEEFVQQESYELKPIYEPNIYVMEDSSGLVTCKHVIEKQHPEAEEAYGKYTYSPVNYNSIEIVIIEEGTKPIMKKYHSKARKTIWTFAMQCDKTKYVFYVPEENIERWQNVHVN